MIQPNLQPLHYSHDFSTDLIKDAVVRYQTHLLGESTVKMEGLQAVQIKGCGLTVLEPGIFSPQYLIFWVFIQENQEEGGGVMQRCKCLIEPEERNHLGWGLVSSSSLACQLLVSLCGCFSCHHVIEISWVQFPNTSRRHHITAHVLAS